MKTKKKSTGFFGKFGENHIVGILLDKGFEVFKPEFDRGTDLIIKRGKRMFSFQIKTRNYQTGKDRHLIIKRKNLREIDFVIYILYNGYKDINFLVIPSKILRRWKGINDIDRGTHYPIKYNYDSKNPKIIFNYKGRKRDLSKYLNEKGLKLIK